MDRSPDADANDAGRNGDPGAGAQAGSGGGNGSQGAAEQTPSQDKTNAAMPVKKQICVRRGLLRAELLGRASEVPEPIG